MELIQKIAQIKKILKKKKNIDELFRKFNNNINQAYNILYHLSLFSDLWLKEIPAEIFKKIIANMSLFPLKTSVILYNLSITHYQFIIDNNGVDQLKKSIPEISIAGNTIKRLYFNNTNMISNILTEATINKLNKVKAAEIDIDYINRRKLLLALCKQPLNAHFFDLARLLNNKKIYIERYPTIKIETMPQNYQKIYHQLEESHQLVLKCSDGTCFAHSVILEAAEISVQPDKWSLLTKKQGEILIEFIYTKKLDMNPKKTEILLEINNIFESPIILDYAINYMAHLIELDLYFRRVHPVWWVLELSLEYKLPTDFINWVKYYSLNYLYQFGAIKNQRLKLLFE